MIYTMINLLLSLKIIIEFSIKLYSIFIQLRHMIYIYINIKFIYTMFLLGKFISIRINKNQIAILYIILTNIFSGTVAFQSPCLFRKGQKLHYVMKKSELQLR